MAVTIWVRTFRSLIRPSVFFPNRDFLTTFCVYHVVLPTSQRRHGIQITGPRLRMPASPAAAPLGDRRASGASSALLLEGMLHDQERRLLLQAFHAQEGGHEHQPASTTRTSGTVVSRR